MSTSANVKDSGVPYAELAKDRYLAHVQRMAMMPWLQEWAGFMAVRYGNAVKVHQTWHDNWLVALMIVRYGENEAVWPSTVTPQDLQRAQDWFSGKTPIGVSYRTPREGLQNMLTLVSLLLVALTTYFLDPWFSIWGVPILLGSALTNAGEDDMVNGLFRGQNATINAWQAATAYSVGDVVRPATWNNRLYRCVVGGTSGGTEPSFSATIGTETTDNGVTWQACAVGPLKTPIFVALYTAAPGETGGGTEVSGGAYARAAAHPSDSNWAATSGSDGQSSNSNDITFPAPSGANWGTVVAFALVDRLSGTSRMFSYGSLAASKIVNDGDQAPKFLAGQLTVTWA